MKWIVECSLEIDVPDDLVIARQIAKDSSDGPDEDLAKAVDHAHAVAEYIEEETKHNRVIGSVIVTLSDKYERLE